MLTKPYRNKIADVVIPFVKSLSVVVIFSPWLLVGYTLVSSYTATLNQNDQEAIRSFIDWFGLIYAFILAWAFTNVGSNFQTLEREFDQERYAVAALLQIVKHLDVHGLNKKKQSQLNEFKYDFRQVIKDYVNHVVSNYRFEYLIPEFHWQGDRILESIHTRISILNREKVIQEPFIFELFHSLNKVMDVRGNRISNSRVHTPLIVQLVTNVASIFWLFSFMGLNIDDNLVASLLIGGVTFIIIIVLIIFFDLSEPFTGIWRIHLTDWVDFLMLIDHEQDPEVIFVYNLENTVYGRLQALTRRDKCRLYSLTHSKRHSQSWKQFMTVVQRSRPDGLHPITCRTFFSNELHEQGISIRDYEWPAVILKRASDYKLILNSDVINACHDLIGFESLFHQEMKKELAWYEP